MASEGTVPYRAEPGFAPLPKNVLIRQTATAGSRPRPTNGRKRSVYPQPPRGHLPLPGGMYASPTNKGTAYTSRKRSRKADGHGGVKTPPYKPTGNGRQNDQADICRALCAERKNRTKTAHLFNVKICPARRQKQTPHRANYSAAARGAAFTKISLADPLDAGRPACYTYGAHQKNGVPGGHKSTNNGTTKRPAPPCRKNRLSTALSLFLLPSLYPNLPT